MAPSNSCGSTSEVVPAHDDGLSCHRSSHYDKGFSQSKLLTLPTELLQDIIGYLSPRCLWQVQQTCRTLGKLTPRAYKSWCQMHMITTTRSSWASIALGVDHYLRKLSRGVLQEYFRQLARDSTDLQPKELNRTVCAELEEWRIQHDIISSSPEHVEAAFVALFGPSLPTRQQKSSASSTSRVDPVHARLDMLTNNFWVLIVLVGLRQAFLICPVHWLCQGQDTHRRPRRSMA